MARFDNWVNTTPGLEELAESADAKIAVAQHYGIATNFVDFSTEPKVAGYFATEGAGMNEAPSEACIICLDVDDLMRFWDGLIHEYRAPEFLKIHVDNLWRMEAQYGVFLFCPYTELDTRIYHMDRIYFPRTHELSGISNEEIYPKRKSHLEQLLDQFFMNEKAIEFQHDFDMSIFRVINLEEDKKDADQNIFPDGITVHPSWQKNHSEKWLQPEVEKFHDVLSDSNVNILIGSSDPTFVAKDVVAQLLNRFSEPSFSRSSLLNWVVEIAPDITMPNGFSESLARRLSTIWDGVRRLPYSNKDIVICISNAAAFSVALDGDLHNSDGRHWELGAQRLYGDTLYIEYGANDGSYSRGYAAVQSIRGSVRSDIGEFVGTDISDEFFDNPVSLLRSTRVPQQVFEFDALWALLVREIIPTQVVMRNTALFYSPLRLTKFGLA